MNGEVMRGIAERIERSSIEAQKLAKIRDAAPAMLEALRAAKELADVMEGLSSGRSDDEWIWAAQSKINDAIAAAEATS